MTDRELLKTCTHLTVECCPRYWEDAHINGVSDEDGSQVPFRNGQLWQPVIELATGKIVDWPQGMTASISYKVCDQGLYFLGTLEKPKLFRYGDHEDSSYVPDDFLCHGDRGYGDYIILDVSDGQIAKYERPEPHPEEWVHATKETDDGSE